MQGEQKQQKKLDLVIVHGRATPIDHFLKIDTSALESHNTVMVVTTCDSYLVLDQDAWSVARAFGLRPPAAPVTAEPGPVAIADKQKGKK